MMMMMMMVIVIVLVDSLLISYMRDTIRTFKHKGAGYYRPMNPD